MPETTPAVGGTPGGLPDGSADRGFAAPVAVGGGAVAAVGGYGPSGVERRPPRRRREGGVLRSRGVRIALGAVIPLVLLAAWQLASTVGGVAPSVLPSPEMVVTAAFDLAERGLLGLYVAISTQRVLLGFAAGAAIGLLLGAVVGLSRFADALLAPTLGAIRTVPSLAWVPLLVIWFGIGEDSKVILIAIGAFFPVYTIVAAALHHVDRQLLEAGRAFGLRGVRLFTAVQLPAVVPSVLSALRLALAQSWLFLVAAELIASSMGLGFLLSDSGNNGRVDRIFLAIILLAVLGKLTDGVLGLVERWAVKRWA